MKSLLGLAAAAMLVLGSCATSNEVNGGGIFQKRKYNKGFYWNKGTPINESATTIKNENLKVEGVNSLDASSNEENLGNGISSTSFKPTTTADLVDNRAKVQSPEKITQHAAMNSLKSNSMLKRAANPIKTLAEKQSQSVKKATSRAKVPRNDGQLGNLLGIILLVILLLLLFTVLDALLGGLLSWILRIVILVVIIVLLLRLLGAL